MTSNLSDCFDEIFVKCNNDSKQFLHALCIFFKKRKQFFSNDCIQELITEYISTKHIVNENNVSFGGHKTEDLSCEESRDMFDVDENSINVSNNENDSIIPETQYAVVDGELNNTNHCVDINNSGTMFPISSCLDVLVENDFDDESNQIDQSQVCGNRNSIYENTSITKDESVDISQNKSINGYEVPAQEISVETKSGASDLEKVLNEENSITSVEEDVRNTAPTPDIEFDQNKSLENHPRLRNSVTPELDFIADRINESIGKSNEELTNHSNHSTCSSSVSEDIFMICTQLPQLSDLVRSAITNKNDKQEQDVSDKEINDVFLAVTQIVPDFVQNTYNAEEVQNEPMNKESNDIAEVNVKKPLIEVRKNDAFETDTQKEITRDENNDSLNAQTQKAATSNCDMTKGSFSNEKSDIPQAKTQTSDAHENQDIFVAQTQIMPTNNDDIFEAETQLAPADNEEKHIFQAETQIASDTHQNNDIFIKPTQMVKKSKEKSIPVGSDDIYEQATQIIITEKSVREARSPSPDIFMQQTQEITNKKRNESSKENSPNKLNRFDKSNDKDHVDAIFEMATQKMPESANENVTWNVDSQLTSTPQCAVIKDVSKEKLETSDWFTQKRRLDKHKWLFENDSDEEDDIFENDGSTKSDQVYNNLSEPKERNTSTEVKERGMQLCNEMKKYTNCEVRLKRMKFDKSLNVITKIQAEGSTSKKLSKNLSRIKVAENTPSKRITRSNSSIIPADERANKVKFEDVLAKRSLRRTVKTVDSPVSEEPPAKIKRTRQSSTGEKDSKIPKRNFKKIIFSRIDNRAKFTEMVKKLGGGVFESPIECSILVCDDFSRTFKVLGAICKGIPIVRSDWLLECNSRKKFVDPTPYHLIDVDYQAQNDFVLDASLERARKNPLFKGYVVFASPNTVPPPSEISQIVECGKGAFLKKLPRKSKQNILIISCKEDEKLWGDYRKQVPEATIISTEGFVECSLHQHTNFTNYIQQN